VALTSGDGFHGTMTPVAASTSVNSFHVMAKASGGVDQWQRLPRHGKGQRWR
jgi:hypothetical protein